MTPANLANLNQSADNKCGQIVQSNTIFLSQPSEKVTSTIQVAGQQASKGTDKSDG